MYNDLIIFHGAMYIFIGALNWLVLIGELGETKQSKHFRFNKEQQGTLLIQGISQMIEATLCSTLL